MNTIDQLKAWVVQVEKEFDGYIQIRLNRDGAVVMGVRGVGSGPPAIAKQLVHWTTLASVKANPFFEPINRVKDDLRLRLGA
jgi:hypothetical protein